MKYPEPKKEGEEKNKTITEIKETPKRRTDTVENTELRKDNTIKCI